MSFWVIFSPLKHAKLGLFPDLLVSVEVESGEQLGTVQIRSIVILHNLFQSLNMIGQLLLPIHCF